MKSFVWQAMHYKWPSHLVLACCLFLEKPFSTHVTSVSHIFISSTQIYPACRTDARLFPQRNTKCWILMESSILVSIVIWKTASVASEEWSLENCQIHNNDNGKPSRFYNHLLLFFCDEPCLEASSTSVLAGCNTVVSEFQFTLLDLALWSTAMSWHWRIIIMPVLNMLYSEANTKF